MLYTNQFERYCSGREIAPLALEYITETRDTEPSRTVGARARSNVCSSVVSEKMGRSIFTESHTAERAFTILSEFDEGVLEFWDQPPPIKIEMVNKGGKPQGVSYTPDFLLLTQSGPVVIEVKTLEKLEELVVERPKNWVRTEKGEFQYLPALKSFQRVGLEHRVFAYSSEQRFKVSNLDLLLKSRKLPKIEASLGHRLSMALEEVCCWDLEALKQKLKLESYGPLFQLIDRGDLYADLDTQNLASPRDVYVAASRPMLEQVQGLRERLSIYADHSARPIGSRVVPSQSDAAKAMEKLEKLEKGDLPQRTSRRYRALVKKGRKEGLSAFQSLLPSHYCSGNRLKKISKRSEDFLTTFLTKTFAESQGLSKYRGFAAYVHAAASQDPPVDPVGRTTFEIRLNQLPASVVAAGRRGRRGENATQVSSDATKRSLKPSLPWQVCAIDHYKADVFVVIHSGEKEVFVARPWITGMIDLGTGKLVALTVSLRDPSKVACAKVIRECVRRHRRLPAEIIVDRGSDFQSVFFSSLLAHYGVTLSVRPAANPRFGGEIESVFGAFKKHWLSQRSGNIADHMEARSVDGEKAPAKSAILSPFDLYRELQHYAAWRDARPNNLTSLSNSDAFEKGQDEFPFIGIAVNDGPEFRLATSVESKAYTVNYERGFHIGDFWYYSPSIALVRGKKSQLEVRKDPENPHLIHTLINGKWEPCFSSHINAFSALSPLSQFEQGLLALEGRNLRQKIKQQADTDLAGLVAQMDSMRDSGQTPIIAIPERTHQKSSDEDVFGDLDLSNLRTISVEGWHAQH